MTEEAPDIEQQLIDFGNTAKAIPYYAVFKPGEKPHHFDGNFLTIGARGFLKTAGIDADQKTPWINKVSEEEIATRPLPPITGASN